MNLDENVKNFIEKQREKGKLDTNKNIRNRQTDSLENQYRTDVTKDKPSSTNYDIAISRYFDDLKTKIKYLFYIIITFLMIWGVFNLITGNASETKDFRSLNSIADSYRLNNISGNFKIAKNYANKNGFYYIGIYVLYPDNVILSNESRQFSEEKIYDYFKNKMEKVHERNGHLRFDFKELGTGGISVDFLKDNTTIQDLYEKKVRIVIIDSTKYHTEDNQFKYDVIKDIRINNEEDLTNAFNFIDSLRQD